MEHRITAYRKAGVSITKGEQERQVTQIRGEHPEYGALNAQSLQVTLDRLHKAYQGFFGRVKNGQKAGFPRFKSRKRWKGFGFKSHGDGWKLFAGESDERGLQQRSGHIRISGVGLVRIRGRGRRPGTPKTCSLTKKNGKWFASVAMKREADREHGSGAVSFDWGIDAFLTLCTDAGGIAEVANRRRDFLHKVSAWLVASFGLIVTEDPAVANMTRSAKGTVEEPGLNVKQKAGLNRSILDGAPATFVSMVRAKAEEAAANLMEAETTELAPTQRCHACWNLPSEKKGLSDRVHDCEHCGATCGRDENASRVLMRWSREELDDVGPAGDRAGVGDAAREGGRTAETPARAAQPLGGG